MLEELFKQYSEIAGVEKEEVEKKKKEAGIVKKLFLGSEKKLFVKKEKKEKPEEKKEEKPKITTLIKPKEDTLRAAPIAKLFAMVIKDLRLLLRSKSSSLIVIFGPLLLILLLGLAFNTSSIYDIKIATYSESYSELTVNLITNLNNQQYKTVQAESLEECIEGVEFGRYHICAEFPKDMQVTNEAENIIKFYVDKSRMNLAHLISNTIFSKVMEESSKISMGLTGNIMDVVSSAKSTLSSEQEKVNSMISGNTDNLNKVSKIKGGLNELNLDVDANAINFTKLENAIENISAKENISMFKMKPITWAIDDLKLEMVALKDAVSAAKFFKSSSESDISAVQSTLRSQGGSINSVKASVDKIITGIEGIGVTRTENIVEPIRTTIEPISSEKTHLSYMFPTLIVLMIMFISILLASSMIIREKLDKAYFRNFITPTNDFLFMFGHYLTNIMLILIQVLIILGVAAYFTQVDPIILLQLAAVLIVVCSVFIMVGTFIGHLFNSEETSTLASISIGAIMLFFSNTVMPIETLPGYIRQIVVYNPFILSEDIIRKMLLFGNTIEQVYIPVLILAGIALGLFILSYIAREIRKKDIFRI